jgi:hypothetical protein
MYKIFFFDGSKPTTTNSMFKNYPVKLYISYCKQIANPFLMDPNPQPGIQCLKTTP